MKRAKSLFEIHRETHLVFDQLWQSGTVTREGAYRILSKITGCPSCRAHIGMLSAKECINVIRRMRKGNFSIADGKIPRKDRKIWVRKDPLSIRAYFRSNIKKICKKSKIFATGGTCSR